MPTQQPSSNKKTPIRSAVVLGGNTFLGARIVRALYELDQRPKINVISNENIPDAKRLQGVTYHQCAYTGNDVSFALQPPLQVVFNATGILPTLGPLASDSSSFKGNDWVSQVNTFLNVASRGNAQVFVHSASTRAIHCNRRGEGRDAKEEDHQELVQKIDPFNPGPGWHGRAERAVLRFGKQDLQMAGEAVKPTRDATNGRFMKTCSIRLPTLYGKGDDLLSGQPRDTCYGYMLAERKARFEAVYVGNAADAHILAAERLLTEGAPPDDDEGPSYFITDGTPMTCSSFASRVLSEGGKSARDYKRTSPTWWSLVKASIRGSCKKRFRRILPRKVPPPFSPYDIKWCCQERTFNIQKARDELSYEPRITTENGITTTAHWSLNQHNAVNPVDAAS